MPKMYVKLKVIICTLYILNYIFLLKRVLVFQTIVGLRFHKLHLKMKFV